MILQSFDLIYYFEMIYISNMFLLHNKLVNANNKNVSAYV